MAFHTNTLKAIFPLFLKLKLPASGGALERKTTHPNPNLHRHRSPVGPDPDSIHYFRSNVPVTDVRR